MQRWRPRIAEVIRQWGVARDRRRRLEQAVRYERQAEELDMAKKGLSRRPNSGF
jgi:hypothetical protein